MARERIPDSTVLIRALRDSQLRQILRQAIAGRRLWLSSVVIAELYAGTRSPQDARLLRGIVDDLRNVDRILTPILDDWEQAGRLIARRTRLQGALRPRDHLADVLILLSAARLKGTVLTANLRHFDAWAQLARAAGMDVTVAPFPP
jgi:predicted nucleic acid-binding protein